MPSAYPVHVVTFSSEDSRFPASNLLSRNRKTRRKWSVQDPKEENAFVVLKLPKAEQISGLVIGNNGSHMIEICVARSGSEVEPKYETLLAATEFMSQADSKLWINPSNVKSFWTNLLTKPVVLQKWDLVKIHARQPFNKTKQHGLTFVEFVVTNPNPSDETQPSRKPFGDYNKYEFIPGRLSNKTIFNADKGQRPVLFPKTFPAFKKRFLQIHSTGTNTGYMTPKIIKDIQAPPLPTKQPAAQASIETSPDTQVTHSKTHFQGTPATSLKIKPSELVVIRPTATTKKMVVLFESDDEDEGDEDAEAEVSMSSRNKERAEQNVNKDAQLNMKIEALVKTNVESILKQHPVAHCKINPQRIVSDNGPVEASNPLPPGASSCDYIPTGDSQGKRNFASNVWQLIAKPFHALWRFIGSGWKLTGMDPSKAEVTSRTTTDIQCMLTANPVGNRSNELIKRGRKRKAMDDTGTSHAEIRNRKKESVGSRGK